MAKEHHRMEVEVELVQEVLLDDPDFLREIVERVLQELLEAEMTDHVGAQLPMSAPRSVSGSVTATRQGP